MDVLGAGRAGGRGHGVGGGGLGCDDRSAAAGVVSAPPRLRSRRASSRCPPGAEQDDNRRAAAGSFLAKSGGGILFRSARLQDREAPVRSYACSERTRYILRVARLEVGIGVTQRARPLLCLPSITDTSCIRRSENLRPAQDSEKKRTCRYSRIARE